MALVTQKQFEDSVLDTLLEYCKIPCLSPMFDAQWVQNGHIEAATQMLATWARNRKLANFDVQIHRLDGRTPVITVTIESTGGGDGTAVLYGHLDKQPPLGEWSEGLEPFNPVRRGDRIYARGVSDDGYSIFAALSALEAMEANNVAHSRCVVLIEACEESGSPDLEAYLDALKDHLGDVELLICLDSGAISYDRLWVTTSLRGLASIELTVKVLEQGRHSGMASGVVPSSFRILRQLIERVEDSATGEILLKELHVEIPEAVRESAENTAKEFGDMYQHELPLVPGLTLMGSSPAGRILNKTWSPTLSVTGMGGIPTPDIAGNVLRAFTTATLSFRLPPTADSKLCEQSIVNAMTKDIPSNAQVTFKTEHADGWNAPELAPWLATALEEASTDAYGTAPGFTGEGGSIPFLASLGKRYPGVQFLATGVLGPDSNAHGIDEMLDIPMAVGVVNSVITVLHAHANK